MPAHWTVCSDEIVPYLIEGEKHYGEVRQFALIVFTYETTLAFLNPV